LHFVDFKLFDRVANSEVEKVVHPK